MLPDSGRLSVSDSEIGESGVASSVGMNVLNDDGVMRMKDVDERTNYFASTTRQCDSAQWNNSMSNER